MYELHEVIVGFNLIVCFLIMTCKFDLLIVIYNPSPHPEHPLFGPGVSSSLLLPLSHSTRCGGLPGDRGGKGSVHEDSVGRRGGVASQTSPSVLHLLTPTRHTSSVM